MTIEKKIKGTAFLLTNGAFMEVDGKTSHGLIRGSTRFTITAVIDHKHFGQDAGMLLDGKNRGIPIFATIEEAMKIAGKPDYCIIGMATVGGKLPQSFEKKIQEALSHSISVINGLHDFLNEKPEFVKLAELNNAQLIDIRKPRSFRELRFWTSEIYSVQCPIIALLGMDCAVGKRTTGQFILEACKRAGKKAEMIYTGQTGWLQGYKYGFIFDATLNDFVSGELSHAVLDAYRNEDPDFIFLEGQSSLRNPSGPCGAELLLSGNAKYVILVHEIGRKHYDENPEWGLIPTVESEIKLIEAYHSKVIALVLNTRESSKEEVKSARIKYERQLDIPVLLPVEEGVDMILPVLEKLKQNEN
ncbi:MAG: DUF1611 domain-containing protein [Cyclobacteriaceae bacterium]|jgi:uncharacterized NAD-dependent epimerase/dehydratase family protein